MAAFHAGFAFRGAFACAVTPAFAQIPGGLGGFLRELSHFQIGLHPGQFVFGEQHIIEGGNGLIQFALEGAQLVEFLIFRDIESGWGQGAARRSGVGGRDGSSLGLFELLDAFSFFFGELTDTIQVGFV